MAKKTYDSALAELSKILNSLQSEDIKIEEMSKLVKKAKELTNYCKDRLREIEEDLKENID